jgi:hypothetical protein
MTKIGAPRLMSANLPQGDRRTKNSFGDDRLKTWALLMSCAQQQGLTNENLEEQFRET